MLGTRHLRVAFVVQARQLGRYLRVSNDPHRKHLMAGPAADEVEANPSPAPLLTGDETLQEELRLRNSFLREIGVKPSAANVVAAARLATTTRASSQHGRDSRAAPVRRKGSRRGSRSTRAGPDDPEEPEPHRADWGGQRG